jgi:hypothetical protein
MVEIILGEEVTVISTFLEDIGDDLLIGTLLQTGPLPSVEVFLGQLNRPLPDRLRILLHMVARRRKRVNSCLRRLFELVRQTHGHPLVVLPHRRCQLELQCLLSKSVGSIEGIDGFGIGHDEVIKQTVLLIGSTTGYLPPVDLLGQLNAVLLDEEDLAGNVVLPNVLD